MKTLKYLTICFVLCCLFSGNVFAQVVQSCDEPASPGCDAPDNDCTPGISCSIDGTILDGPYAGLRAEIALPGNTIAYTITVTSPAGECALKDLTGFVTWPDAVTEVDIEPIACLPPNTACTQVFVTEYVISPDDYGKNGAGSNAVKALFDVFGDSVRRLFDEANDCANEFSTIVINPEVEIVKVPICVDDGQEIVDGIAVGQEVIWRFTITNTGQDPLEFKEINDPLLAGLLPAIPDTCGTLDDPLLPGETCTFDSQPYLVTDTPDPLVNEVDVAFYALGELSPGFYFRLIDPITDEDVIAIDDYTSEVDVVDPSFDISCLFLRVDGDNAIFEVTLANTGDVDLDVVTSCIGDGILVAQQVVVEEVPVPINPDDGCGGSAEFICTATATLVGDYCADALPEQSTGLCVYDDPCVVDWTLEKECVTSPWNDGAGPCNLEPGDTAEYLITVTNNGTCDLDIFVDDPRLGIAQCVDLPSGGQPVQIGGSETVPDGPDDCPTAIGGDPMTENTVTAVAYCDSDIPCDGVQLDTKEASATCCYTCCDPDFEVVKNCLTNDCNDLGPGDLAEYEIIITNTGDCDGLVFLVEDPGATPPTQGAGPLAVDESVTLTVTIPVPQCLPDDPECNELVNVVTVTGTLDGYEETKSATAFCEYKCLPPEGCTPGFWKNHPDCWRCYSEETLVSDVWSALSGSDPNYVDLADRKWDPATSTLYDSIRYRGGSGLAGAARNMLRHATAALLNSCSGDVGYPLSVDFIIEQGNIALASGDIGVIQDLHTILAGLNEDSPCPIDAHCIRHEDGYDD